MIEFLHNFNPHSSLLSIGPITIYWYGLLIVLAIISALTLSLYLAKKYKLSTNIIFDLSFWLIIGGLLGARIYEIFLMLPYYLNNPWQSLRIWEGGLAIHGAIIGGLIVLYVFTNHHKLDFWRLISLFAPGLALGQAIGRWGNYFNQELFGLPTNAAWGIPIDILNRPNEYSQYVYFHPTFLYESFGCLVIALILVALNTIVIKQGRLNARFYLWSSALYVILYSSLRFGLEFIRLDDTPMIFGWRWPQIASLIMIIVIGTIIIFKENEYKSRS